MFNNIIKRVEEEAVKKGVERIVSDSSAASIFKAKIAGELLGKFLGSVIELGTNEITRTRNENKADLRILDKEYGVTWKLTRPLTNKEKARFVKQVKSGKTIGEVLLEMGVLADE